MARHVEQLYSGSGRRACNVTCRPENGPQHTKKRDNVDQPRALRKILRACHCETHTTHSLFALFQLSNDVRNVGHVVIFECVFGGSQCYVVCCGLGARNDLMGQSCK